jgi:hypothetical protein
MLQPLNFAELELCHPNYMKPNSQISRQFSRLDEEHSSSRLHSNQPRTDFEFHAPASDVESASSSRKLSRPVFAPGFRDLSNEFLATETKRNYVAEVLFFAIIVGVSTWPIVSMMRAVAQFMK